MATLSNSETNYVRIIVSDSKSVPYSYLLQKDPRDSSSIKGHLIHDNNNNKNAFEVTRSGKKFHNDEAISGY